VGSPEFFELVEARRGRARLTYTVKPGDDLKRVGKKFGLTVADLERINRFGAGATSLVVGQKLTVYRAMSAAEKAKAACRITPGGVDPDGEATAAKGTAPSESPADEADEAETPADEAEAPEGPGAPASRSSTQTVARSAAPSSAARAPLPAALR